ncbi:MAG: signal peptidase II [Hyphomicrobiaceae bacterium]
MTVSRAWHVAIGALVLDQFTKLLVLEIIDLPANGAVVVVPSFLKFVLVWNTGVNFGILASDSMLLRWSLVVLALAVVLGLLWWVRRGAPKLTRLGAGLIAGGALGNAIDRIAHGAVVDFINVSAPGIDNPFAFNVADVWIFVGAALIILSGSVGAEDAS